MPNHLHGIVEIVGARANVRANGRSPVQFMPDQSKMPTPSPVQFKMQSKSIGSFVAGFKSIATKNINQMRGMPGEKVWQRNYWEHIVRDENEYQRISEYIINNPMKWDMDKLNGGTGNQVMGSPYPLWAEYFLPQ